MTFWTDLLGTAFEVSYIDAGGIRTRRLVAGEGEPIIFTHGITGHLEAFVSVVPQLVAAGFQCHLIDMVGHGYSGSTGNPLGIPDFAKHVIDYVDACGIDRANFAGLSLGGWTTAWIGGRYPERVKRLILVAPAGDPKSRPAYDPAFSEAMIKLTRDGVMSTDKSLTRKRLEGVISNPQDITDELVDVRYAVYHRPEFQAGLDNVMWGVPSENFLAHALTPERLGKIAAETLVVFGEDDPSGGGTAFLADGIGKVKIIVFEGTGHWPAFERPADFAEIAIAFFRDGLGAVQDGVLPRQERISEAA